MSRDDPQASESTGGSARGSSYGEAGVDVRAVEAAMGGIGRAVRATFGYNPRSRVLLDIGFFANVLEIGEGPCIAVSTDSAGTKVLVAELTGRHDTIGIDCVAMNVNDVLCVGAEPVCFLDYIGIDEAGPEILTALVEGVRRGCELAECSLPGGEVAQVGELVRGVGDGPHYDLIGTAVGTVPRDRIVTGREIVAGDLVLGIASSGLHSNGYTLARKVFFERLGLGVDDQVDELGRTVGEELLEPTSIYVREVKAMLAAGLPIHGLANITGDGLLNLLRLETEGLGYVLDDLPEPQAVFGVIAEAGEVDVEEMYRVFNMGVGFCVVLPEESAEAALRICSEQGKEARVLGRVVEDAEHRLLLPGPGLVGDVEGLRRMD